MIIGQFGESYPPTIDGVGGVMLNYCREMNRRGHRCLYVAPENKTAEAPADCETLLYGSMGLPRIPYRFGIPQLQPAFRKTLEEIPFDLVHAHTPFLAGRMARDVAKKRKIPLIATFHSKYYDDIYRVVRSHTLTKQAVRKIVDFYYGCDEVWAVNERTGLVLRSYGYRGPIVVMQNGINVEERQVVSDISDLGLREDVPQLLFVGQQDYKKGTRELLDACAILRKSGVPFHLTMVGEGQDRQALERLARENGIGDVVLFTGKIADRPRLMAIYSRADLFVFPSVYDNAPLVVREAALMGTPSIVVAGSCAAEGIEHGVNGYYCDGSAEDIARQIQAALPGVKTVGEAARHTIPITWKRIGGHIEERYLALLEKNRVRPTDTF